MYLKQSTAATVLLGPFIDDADFKTAKTALTVAQANIRLSKAGGAFAQSHNAAGATHDENGYYDVPLDTTDTGTLGLLRVAIKVTNALAVWRDFIVLPATVYDVLVTNAWNAANGGGDVQRVAGTAQTAGDLAGRLTATRAGYLDNLSAAIATNADMATLLTRITAAVALNSDMATVLSRLSATRAGYLDNLSGGAVGLNSDIATLLSRITAAVALNSDMASVLGRLPAALVGGRMDSNVSAINGVTAAAVQLALSTGLMTAGVVDTVVNTHTPTTTVFQSDTFTEATADHYKGRLVLWTGGSLAGQVCEITAYQRVGGIGQFTVSALTEAPVNDETFILI